MKISRNMIIMCLFFGGQSVGLFGAIGSRGTKAIPTRPGAPVVQAPALPARPGASVAQAKPDILQPTIAVMMSYLKKPAEERTVQDYERANMAYNAFNNYAKDALSVDAEKFETEKMTLLRRTIARLPNNFTWDVQRNVPTDSWITDVANRFKALSADDKDLGAALIYDRVKNVAKDYGISPSDAFADVIMDAISKK